MDPITAAIVGFTVKAFSENDEAKKLKNDVFGGFVQWVRPLFIKDDPVAEAVLTNEETPAAVKEATVKAKLPQVMENNPVLAEELRGWVEKLKAAGISERNILEDNELEVDGDVHIGDKGKRSADGEQSGRENVAKGNKIKAGGSFRLGNDYEE